MIHQVQVLFYGWISANTHILFQALMPISRNQMMMGKDPSLNEAWGQEHLAGREKLPYW